MRKMHWFGLIAITLWMPIPWLYIESPAFLEGHPLSLYALVLYLGGVSMSGLALYSWFGTRVPAVIVRSGAFLYILVLVGAYQLSGLAPAWDCLGKQLYVSVAHAQSGCTTTCTNNKVKPCSGWSSCWDKFVSCNSSGIDQDGRPCQGCCFSCTITCPTSEPPPAPTSTIAPTQTPTITGTPTSTFTPTLTPTNTSTATFTSTPTPTFTPTLTPTNTPSPTPTPHPPTLTGRVICDLWGDAGWCRGNATLELTASDPQGFDLSISGDLSGVPFTCGSSCNVPLPEGIGTANFTALSTSGRSTSGSSTWLRDGTPPELNVILPTVNGRNGWYLSAVELSASATDAVSGLFSLTGSLDGGGTWTSFPIQFTDGDHQVLIHAIDVAGNETVQTRSIRVDTVPPIVQFTSHSNGDSVQGYVLLKGGSEDGTSGTAGGELSLDGGTTWQAVSRDSSDAWYFVWKSNEVPNGQYTLLMHGQDQAGNVGNPASVTLIVDNIPPGVSITERWWIWESGLLKVSPNHFPIASVKVIISDPLNRWPELVMNFDPEKVPGSINWNRRFADGMLAPSGEYVVKVVVCDVHDLCGSDVGVIAIPIAATSTVTMTVTLTPTLTVIPQATTIPTQKLATPTMVLVTPMPGTPSAPAQPRRSIPFWQLLGLLGLFIAISSASVVDRRPGALDRLRESIYLISKQNDIDSSRDEEQIQPKGM